MASASPYERLKSCTEDVKNTIKSDLSWFAGELNKEEIVLTDVQFNQVTDPTSMLTDDQKAAEVTKHLLARLKLDPDYLDDDFVEILKKKERRFRPLLKKLDQGGSAGGRGGGGADGVDNGAKDAISKATPIVAGTEKARSPVPPVDSAILKKDVKLTRLNIIRYTNPEGEEKALRLIEEMSPNWMALGQTAEIGVAKLQGFQTKNMNVNKGCMQDVATSWMNMLSKNYPATWEGLIKLLTDTGDMKHLVKQIKDAAADKNSTLYQ